MEAELNKKLKEILQAVWKEDNHYFAIEAGSYSNEGNTDEALLLIKKTFEANGYKREWNPDNPFALPRKVLKNIPPYKKGGL